MHLLRRICKSLEDYSVRHMTPGPSPVRLSAGRSSGSPADGRQRRAAPPSPPSAPARRPRLNGGSRYR